LIVGNDIVDLGDPEARRGACHPGFDARVFAPSELASLAACQSRETMRWALWSAKEAAYKAACQENSKIIFSPVRFVVQLDRGLRGFVTHEDRRWPLHVRHRDDCVHALVVIDESDSDEGSSVIWEARRLTATELGDPSQSVRELAVATIAERLGVSAATLRIQRSGRIPQLLVAGTNNASALSLSHHGSYVGFAFCSRAGQGVLH